MALRRPIEILIEAKDRTAAAFRSVNSQLEKTAGRLRDIGTRLGLAFGVFAGGGVAANVKATADQLDRLAKDASNLKTTTEELSKLQFAFAQTGVSAEVMVNGLSRVLRTLGDARNGSATAAEAFEQLGLSVKDLSALPVEEIIKQIADGLAEIPIQADKSRIAFTLFGRAGKDILNTLAVGSRGLEDFGSELERLGGVIDSDAAKAAEKFNDDLNKMQVQFNALSVAIGGKLIPNWTAWLDLVNGGDINRIGAGGLVSKEIEEVNTQIVNLQAKIKELSSGPSIGDAVASRGVSLEDLAQRQEKYVDDLVAQLERLRDKRQELTGIEADKRAHEQREAAERQHNREMASARGDQTKALQATLQNRLKLFQEHITNTQSFQNQQRQLTEEINRLLNDIGTSSEPVERIDVLRKSVEAWDQLGQGNFGKVLSLVKDGLGLLSEYEGTGEASSASVTTLKESFRSLAEQAGKAQDADLTKSVKAGQEQFAKLKKEISTKPATLIVIPDQSSGKNVHTETQRQLKKEGPVVVDVALNITGVVGQSGGGDVSADQGLASEVESQSDKRGHRV